jgi:hypothetical protein
MVVSPIQPFWSTRLIRIIGYPLQLLNATEAHQKGGMPMGVEGMKEIHNIW